MVEGALRILQQRSNDICVDQVHLVLKVLVWGLGPARILVRVANHVHYLLLDIHSFNWQLPVDVLVKDRRARVLAQTLHNWLVKGVVVGVSSSL